MATNDDDEPVMMTHCLPVPVSTYVEIKQAAQAAGTTPLDWLRGLIDRALQSSSDEDKHG